MSYTEDPNIPPQHPGATPPPPPAASPISTGAAATTGTRPTAVLVIGIVLLCFAGFSLLSVPLTIINITMHVPEVIMPHATTLVLNLITLTWEVVLGIGLLRMAPWARVAGIILFVLAILQTTVITSLTLLRMTMPATTGLSPEVMNGIKLGAGIGGLVFTVAIYGTMIYFLCRKEVVTAFAARR